MVSRAKLNSIYFEFMTPNDIPPSSGLFPMTRWSMIRRAKDGSATEARSALNHIGAAYWQPLYVYARRFGLDETEARDAVQDAFAHLLQEDRLMLADASRGKLRTFLLTALKNIIGENRRRDLARKRGGDVERVSLNMTDAEGRYLHDAASSDDSPDRAFEKHWAHDLLEAAKQRLRAKYAEDGKGALFDALAPALADGDAWGGHAAAAQQLGTSEGALKVALHRLRQRFREALIEEVRETVETEEQVKEEVAYLIGLFGS